MRRSPGASPLWGRRELRHCGDGSDGPVIFFCYILAKADRQLIINSPSRAGLDPGECNLCFLPFLELVWSCVHPSEYLSVISSLGGAWAVAAIRIHQLILSLSSGVLLVKGLLFPWNFLRLYYLPPFVINVRIELI